MNKDEIVCGYRKGDLVQTFDVIKSLDYHKQIDGTSNPSVLLDIINVYNAIDKVTGDYIPVIVYTWEYNKQPFPIRRGEVPVVNLKDQMREIKLKRILE